MRKKVIDPSGNSHVVTAHDKVTHVLFGKREDDRFWHRLNNLSDPNNVNSPEIQNFLKAFRYTEWEVVPLNL